MIQEVIVNHAYRVFPNRAVNHHHNTRRSSDLRPNQGGKIKTALVAAEKSSAAPRCIQQGSNKSSSPLRSISRHSPQGAWIYSYSHPVYSAILFR